MPDLSLKYVFQTVTASAADKNLPSCTISTINADREGDRVVPEGGDFADFMRSPVLMWAHGGKDGYASVPIGSVTAIEVQPGQGIKAAWKWLENDPFADRIRNAWEQGVVRASSIGFKPVKASPNGQGLDHEQWILLELSLCAIPMNPEAVRSLKSLGLMGEETPDPLRTELDALKAAFAATQQKRGRAISAVNESRLRAAMDALASAGAVLTEVLAQIMPMHDDDMPEDHEEDGMKPEHPDDEEMPKKPMPMMALDDAESYSLKMAEDQPSELRLMLVDDDTSEPFVTLIDDRGHEPTFSIDPLVMRSVVAEAVREQLQAALIEPIGESVRRALDHARGRVH